MTAPTAVNQPSIDTWAVVKLMGHKQLAGKVSEHVLGGVVMIRVDVPETQQARDAESIATKPGYTKYVGAGSIYALTPCTEEVARRAAHVIERYSEPIPVDIRSVPLLPARATEDTDFDLDDDDDLDADDDIGLEP